jgi:opacity protein-like surface antigen
MLRPTSRTAVHPFGLVRLLACLLLLSPLTALTALADQDESPDYSRTGFYVGGGLTYATDLYEDEIQDQVGFAVDIDDTFGANARAGARFFRFVGVELQYEWLDSYDIKIPNAGGKAKVDTQTATINLKLYLPIKRFQPYLLGGIGFQRYELDGNFFNGTVQFKQDEYEMAGRLGVGIDLYFTENVVFFFEGSAVLSDAEIKIPTISNVNNLFYAGVETGLMWRF